MERSNLSRNAVAPGIVWMAGTTPGIDLPVTPNAIQPESGGFYEGFITLWDMNSSELRYCSYLGGGDLDGIQGVTAISDSLLVVGGLTRSADFPTTEGVIEPIEPDNFIYDGFITVMNPYSHIIASTYFGVECSGVSLTRLRADSAGISFFGQVWGQGLPLSPNAYDSIWNDGANGNPDIFVARLSPDLTVLEYGSFLGGTEAEDNLKGEFDHNGHAWITGETFSSDLPTTEGAYDREVGPHGSVFAIQFQIPDLDTPVSIRPFLPSNLSLSVFPNPFNPSTTISFTLPHRAQTSLEVYNLLGQSVYTIDLGRLPAGEHQHLFDAASLPSGSYLTRLNTGDTQSISKMVLVR